MSARLGPTGRRPSSRGFSRALLASLARSNALRIRAGATSDHRFIGIWCVVVNGGLFVRSWSLTPGGWYRTFLDDPHGAIRVGEREVKIRALRARPGVYAAVERAYAEKYATPGSAKYVRGFRTPRRRAATLELRLR